MFSKIIFFLYFCLKFSNCFLYDYELIYEFIPKRGYLQLNESYSYKIYKYTPVCNEDIDSKIIYIESIFPEPYFIEIYFYDDYSKIQQNDKGEFLNGEKEYSNRYKNISCNKEYYFVLFNYGVKSPEICSFQLSIINKDNDGLILSPSLSNIFIFFASDNIFYSSSDDYMALISSYYDCGLKIYENETLIFNNSNLKYTQNTTFLKNTNYNTIFFNVHINNE